MASSAFELRFLPDDNNKPRLFLIQLPLRTRHMTSVDAPRTIAHLDGKALTAARPVLGTLLRTANVDEAQISQLFSRDHTLPVSEEVAMRLGLVFQAVNSLRSPDRVQAAIDRISHLDEDDLVYWLKKLTAADSEIVDKHRRALLTVLIEV